MKPRAGVPLSFGLLAMLCGCIASECEAQYDFARADLVKFYRDNKETRRSRLSKVWPKGVNSVEELHATLEASLNQEVVGTLLGTRRVSRREDRPETLTWYVGAANGSIYACMREFSDLQPFQKYAKVRLSRQHEDARLTDSVSGLSVLVGVTELLEYELPGRLDH